MNFKIYLQLTPPAMTDSGKNKGTRKYKNLNILANEKAF